MALALALHAVAFAGLAWIAAREAALELPAIPVALLADPAPEPPALAESPAPPAPVPPVRAPAPAPARRSAPRSPVPPQVVAAPAPQAAAAPPAPAPADPDRVYGEGEVDAVAVPVGRITPRYPPRMELLGREATVVLDVAVDATGRVTGSAVRQSAGGDFDASTREAVARQRFEPARRGGRAVASRVTYRYRFQLE